MIPQRKRLSLQSPLNTFFLLVLHLLLPQPCTGQSQLMGPSQPIVAAVGDDVVLPCYLEPAVDVAAMTLEWTRSDLKPIFVHVWRNSQDVVHAKNPSYKDRTSLSVDEMKRGNISLKLSDVKPSDQGTYQCYIPKLDKGSSVQLVVGAVALAMIGLAGMDRDKGGVMLNCESKGWYPEPEVLWLDGEGNLLSAGPAETVQGPDDLYTVSSRVTVEKRHSNRFTCRVQQKDINQTREAHIHVPDDFFEVQSSSSSSSVIIGLAVFLAVCILIILLLVFLLWRQNKNKTRRHPVDEADSRAMKKHNESEEGGQSEQLMPHKKRQHEGSSSDDRPVIKVDQYGQYIHLINSSDQDQQLGGWMLKLQVNNKEPVSFTFDPSIILRAGKKVTLWCQGYGTNYPPTDLVWRDLKKWSPEDHLQIFLYSNTGEIKSELL